MIEEIHELSLTRIRRLQEFLRRYRQWHQGLTVVASSPFIVDEDGYPYPGSIENLRLVKHYQVLPGDVVLDEELEYVESEIEECQYPESDLELFAEWAEYLIDLLRDNFEQYETDHVKALRKQMRLH